MPSGVTLSLAIDNQNNPAITLRPKTQLRFKQNDRLFFTPSSATAGTIRIFLFLDESNLLEFDQSQYSSESTISGTVTIDGTVDVTKIGGSTTPVTNWTEVLKSTSTTGTRQTGYGIINQNPVATTAYTVPVSTVSYLHSIYTMCSQSVATGGLAYFYLYDSAGVLLSSLSTCQLITTAGNSETATFTYSTPLKMVAGETLRVVSNANMYQNWGYYLTEVT